MYIYFIHLWLITFFVATDPHYPTELLRKPSFPPTIHYVHAYNYVLYVLSKEGDRQQFLWAKLKLVKLPFSTTHS